MLYHILHITTIRIWTKLKNPNSKQKFGLPLARFRMELGGETWWWSVWRRRDSKSVGGSSRSSRGARGAVDQLAVGVGGDCGKRMLAAVVCVCVFLLGVGGVECWLEGGVVTYEAWGRGAEVGVCCVVSRWGLRGRPWGVREGSEAAGCGWVRWVCGLLFLCLYLYWFCASISVMCAVYVCGVWGCVACGLCSVLCGVTGAWLLVTGCMCAVISEGCSLSSLSQPVRVVGLDRISPDPIIIRSGW